MSTPAAQEAVAKDRIIKHMNADHADSIRRYLEAFKQQSFYQVRDARMTDITLDEMKISSSGQQRIIPFNPPMKSLREARQRLVDMDKNSLQLLGRSDIIVTEFIPPHVNLIHLFNFTQCMLTYIVFSRATNLKPGSLLFDTILWRLPKFASFLLAIRVPLMVLMVGIHSVETVIMIRKLSRHGVTPFDSFWWPWVGCAFVEGVTSFKRMDGLIEEKKKAKEAKKH